VNAAGNRVVLDMRDAREHRVVAHVHSADAGLLYLTARERLGERRSLVLSAVQARAVGEALVRWAAERGG
jgi:hypothetical protein